MNNMHQPLLYDRNLRDLSNEREADVQTSMLGVHSD